MTKEHMRTEVNHSGLSFHNKLIWILMLFALVPLIILSLVNYYYLKEQNNSAIAESLKSSSKVHSMAINSWFDYRFAEITQISQSKLPQTLLSELITARGDFDGTLKQFVGSKPWVELSEKYGRELVTFSINYEYVYDIFLIDNDGNILYTLALEDDLGTNLISGKYQDTRFAEATSKSLLSPGVYFSDIERYGPSSGLISGFLVTQMYDQLGQKIGHVAMQFKMDNIYESLDVNNLVGPNKRYYLVGQDGILRSKLNSLVQVLNLELSNTVGQTILNNPKAIAPIAIDDTDSFTGDLVDALISPIEVANKRWYLVVESEPKSQNKLFWHFISATMHVFVVAIIASFLLARKTSRSFSSQIEKLTKASLAYINGDTRSSNELTSTGEFGQLNQAIRSLLTTIHERDKALKVAQQETLDNYHQSKEQQFAIDQHAIVTVTDLAGTIEYANNKFTEISGYSQQELIGNNHRILNSGHHPKKFFKDMFRELGRGETWQGQICNRAKNGSLYWVDSTIVPLKNSDGKTTKYIAIRTDITSQKLASSAIEKTKQQLELVISSTGVGIWDWHIESGKAEVNERWAAMLGYTIDELLPVTIDTWRELAHPNYVAKLDAWVKQASQDNLSVYGNETLMKHKDGHWVWVLDSGNIVEWDAAGNPLRMVGTHVDITEQKHKQQELINLSRIASQTDNAILVTDVNGVTEWVNDSFTKVTGYALEDVRGKKPGHLLQGENTDAEVVKRISEAVKKQQPFHETLINYHKSGAPYWIEIKCNPILDDDQNVSGFMAITADVTEQKNTLDQLALQQRLLQNMSRLGRMGAWQVDLRSNEIYWSPMTKQIHEVEEDYVPQLDTAINFYKEGYSRDRIGEVVARGMESGLPWTEELQLVTAKGNEIWVAAYGEVQKEGDEVVRLFGSFQDINERKLKEIEDGRVAEFNRGLAEINLSPEVLSGNTTLSVESVASLVSSALSVSRCSIWVCDEEQLKATRIYCAGNALHSGAGRGEVNPKVFENVTDIRKLRSNVVLPSIANDDVRQPLNEYFEVNKITSIVGQSFTISELAFGFILVEHIGQEREWLDAEVRFVGSLATILSSVFTMEQKRITQEKLVIAKEDAEQAAKAKSEFLATMSHEIRTPMNGILGMLELLGDEHLDSEQQRKIQIATSSANALLNVINEILDFSRLDAGKLQLEHIDFDLRMLFENTCSAMALMAYDKGLELLVDIRLPLGLEVNGDPVRLRQIVTNLLANAIKFTYRGVVTLRVELQEVDNGYMCEFNISDTGIGISKEKLALLFEPFTQVDASTTRKFGGSGLGLAICRRLADAMSGQVEVESEVDKGSTFTVKLPFDGHITDEQSRSQLIAENSGKTAIVLMAEQNSAQIICQIIEQLGFDAKSCSGVEELAQLKNTSSQDILLFDLDCLQRKLSESTLSSVESLIGQFEFAFALSAFTNKELIKSLSHISGLGFLHKPLMLSELSESLQQRLLQSNGDEHEELSVEDSSPDKPNSVRKILLVEDNKVNQQVAGFMLKKLGYEFQIAENGTKAMDALAQAESYYDLILMDCQMPDMDGYEATSLIRDGKAGQHYVAVPIIALTANAMQGDKEKCIAAGMDRSGRASCRERVCMFV